MARNGKDKCKFIKKLWGEVIRFVKTLRGWMSNIDNWIEASKPASVVTLMTAVAIYLIYDIIGEVPEALHINLAMLSAVLGGLVFTGASLYRKNTETRKSLLGVAKKFIIATFLFLIFFVFFIFIKDVSVAPFSFDFYKEHLVYAIFFWLAALGIYGGSYFFALALVDFVISLRRIR